MPLRSTFRMLLPIVFGAESSFFSLFFFRVRYYQRVNVRDGISGSDEEPLGHCDRVMGTVLKLEVAPGPPAVPTRILPPSARRSDGIASPGPLPTTLLVPRLLSKRLYLGTNGCSELRGICDSPGP